LWFLFFQSVNLSKPPSGRSFKSHASTGVIVDQTNKNNLLYIHTLENNCYTIIISS